MLEIPNFETKKELFDFLIKNKNTLLAQKMNETKHADGVGYVSLLAKTDTTTSKSVSEDKDLNISAVINTTNIMDSHKDVHIQGLWQKSLSENKRILHVQEHKSNDFDKIISSGEDLKAYTKSFNWTELGYNAIGKTEALVFDSKVKKERNEYMYNQYKNGYVDNHSVGMRYVKLVMCVNDEDYGAEYEAWEKYYPQIINKEEADKFGYFWAVTEAKVIEGSAVPLGSNPITPTLNIKNEPPQGTQKTEAAKALQERKNYLLNLN